jgi:hypothetical protein
MPWIVVRRGNKSCVVNKLTDSVKGCHSTRKEALAQMRAIYANTKDEEIGGRRAKRD